MIHWTCIGYRAGGVVFLGCSSAVGARKEGTLNLLLDPDILQEIDGVPAMPLCLRGFAPLIERLFDRTVRYRGAMEIGRHVTDGGPDAVGWFLYHLIVDAIVSANSCFLPEHPEPQQSKGRYDRQEADYEFYHDVPKTLIGADGLPLVRLSRSLKTGWCT